MDNNSEKLEKRVWYRSLKVLYGVGWIIVFIITGIAFLILKPTPFIDLSKSSVTCLNKPTYNGHENYSLENAKGLYQKGDKYLTMEDHLMATKICGLQLAKLKEETVKNAGYSEKEIENKLANLFDMNSDDFKNAFQTIEAGRKKPQYQINFVSNDSGTNWLKSLAGTTIVFMVAIFILNLIRNIVLYITIGEKFSYWWLISNKDNNN